MLSIIVSPKIKLTSLSLKIFIAFSHQTLNTLSVFALRIFGEDVPKVAGSTVVVITNK